MMCVLLVLLVRCAGSILVLVFDFAHLFTGKVELHPVAIILHVAEQ